MGQLSDVIAVESVHVLFLAHLLLHRETECLLHGHAVEVGEVGPVLRIADQFSELLVGELDRGLAIEEKLDLLFLWNEVVHLENWPGMVGHNWGAEHAERWIWIHGAGFDDRQPSDYVDIAAGRIKIGRWTTPWIANGAIALDGEVMRLGGLGRTYGTTFDEQPGGCEFVVPGGHVTLRGAVGAPLDRFVGWVYADPGGGEHHAINCSVADMRFRVERPGEPHVHLQVEGGAAFELGMRETDHGATVQPFPDG